MFIKISGSVLTLCLLQGCFSSEPPSCSDAKIQDLALKNHMYEMTDLSIRMLKKRMMLTGQSFDYLQFIKQAKKIKEEAFEKYEYRLTNVAPTKIEENIEKSFCEANVERTKKGKDKWKSVGPDKIAFTAQLVDGDLKIENASKGIEEFRRELQDIKSVLNRDLEIVSE
jgi:hypothetical protein